MTTMAVNETATLVNSSSVPRSVFFCPKWPQLTWDLNHTTSRKIIVAVMTTACPVTVLLNLLVIIAVKTREELKRNSNILLSSLAAVDLVVGAVSMPLTVTLDSLFLQVILFENVICTIQFISFFVLHTTCVTSFLHLLLIAWERHLAVTKWMDYKVLVTRRRLNTYITIAWMVSTLAVALLLILQVGGVKQVVIYIVDGIASLFLVFCLLLIVYFYVMLYITIRKRNRTQVRQVNALIKAKLESQFASTAFLLTLLVSISVIPTIVISMFAGVSSSLRESSVFRWIETILQLNSLFNPLLYFYRNRRFRKAAFELLRCTKSSRIQADARTVRHIRRRRYSMGSINIEDFHNQEQRPRLTRSESCDAVMCSDRGNSHQACAVKERSMSAPPCVAISEVFTHQQNKIVVTVQIENVSRRKAAHENTELRKNSKGLKRSRHRIGGKTVRSSSQNCDQNTAEEKLRRSNSMATLPTNFVASGNKLTVDDLKIGKGTASKRYEETKL